MTSSGLMPSCCRDQTQPTQFPMEQCLWGISHTAATWSWPKFVPVLPEHWESRVAANPGSLSARGMRWANKHTDIRCFKDISFDYTGMGQKQDRDISWHWVSQFDYASSQLSSDSASIPRLRESRIGLPNPFEDQMAFPIPIPVAVRHESVDRDIPRIFDQKKRGDII